MKNFVVFLIVLGTGVCWGAGMDLSEWRWRCGIEESGGEGFVRVELEPWVYEMAKGDLADLRVVDANGGQKAYLLYKERDVDKRVEYSPAVINKATDGEKRALVTLDFGEQVWKNVIEVVTGGSNFRRAVKVEGSNDNVTFYTLVERGYLFAVNVEDKSRFEDIDLPGNDWRYLRVTVERMSGEEEAAVIQTVRAFRREKEFAKRTEHEAKLVSAKEDVEEKSSIYEYDLGYRRLPVSEIEFSVGDESYYRFVTVEGRDAATRKVEIDSEDNVERYREVEERWQNVASGRIDR